jgi:predicted O-linked N-acetylglucosamine transferase (SPINDLY family)
MRQNGKSAMDNSDALETLFHQAVQLHNRGQLADAILHYDGIIRQDPDVALVHSNRGAALSSLQEHEEALRSFDRAVQLRPDYAEAHNNKANALVSLKRPAEAVLSYDQAIAIKSHYAEAHYNRGNALKDLNRPEEAIRSYDRAIAIKPDFAEAYCNRGNALKDLQRWGDALASYDAARTLKPDMDFLLGAWLYAKLQVCDFSDLGECMEEVSSALRQNKRVCTPFQMLAIAGSPELQRRAAEIYVEAQPSSRAAQSVDRRNFDGGKIRLGYFSADFHDHATMHLMAGLFERHDRSKFELIAFSFGPDRSDEMRIRAVRAFDQFIDVRGRSDAEVATLSRTLGVDIAIDLKGFTQDNRAGIFASRAAPIQVNYLGYPGTMGAGYMDYIIADQVLIPAEEKRHYREKILFLPNSYQVNDRERFHAKATPNRSAPGLPPSGFVFCCFNNNFKIMPTVFDCWMRILTQCPQSVLWILADNTMAANNLRKEAWARGITEDRLVFAPRVPLREHLTRLRSADLFLDTLPYNAHTTASEALWAGLPVLTCAGHAFSGRVAASVLNAAGLPELVTTSLKAYETLAIELASQPDRLAAIRQKLAANRLTSPLFDTEQFARRIEAAYSAMHERYRTGLPPADIHIAA